MEKGLIIAIDGPSGVGKSTIAKLVAEKLEILYIDTGAIYRAITWKALENHVDLEDESSILKMIKGIKIQFKYIAHHKKQFCKLFLDKEDVTRRIRSPRIDKHVSDIAKLPKIRLELITLQRRLAKNGSIVMEGRDIGSTILKNADLKFFFIASAEQRANRRYKELKDKGYKITYEEVKEQLANRDHIDSKRKSSPLKKAKDAIVIDSTNKSIKEVIDDVLYFVDEYRKKRKITK